jgi:hypothetical protein
MKSPKRRIVELSAVMQAPGRHFAGLAQKLTKSLPADFPLPKSTGRHTFAAEK